MAALALGLGLAACGPKPSAAPQGTVGLSSSLPLVWGESGDLRGQLANDAPRHWAMRVLEEQGRVVPLDSLAGRRGLPLPQDALLVLIQPRSLTPDENVALDTWVRAGGHVLVFADPMLTMHSAFALGDPRRPQDVAMLSPILDHWGLSLEFDDTQRNEERYQQVRGTSIPVNLRGQLRVSPAGACRTEATKLLADCRIGKGRAVVIADAALFDGEDAGRVGAFRALISLAAS